MKIAIRRIGASQGIVIPKSWLARIGIDAQAEMAVENGAIVLRPACRPVREGWAEASRALAAAGDDGLGWPEFAA